MQLDQLLLAISRQAQFQIDHEFYRDCWLPALYEVWGVKQ